MSEHVKGSALAECEPREAWRGGSVASARAGAGRDVKPELPGDPKDEDTLEGTELEAMKKEPTTVIQEPVEIIVKVEPIFMEPESANIEKTPNREVQCGTESFPFEVPCDNRKFEEMDGKLYHAKIESIHDSDRRLQQSSRSTEIYAESETYKKYIKPNLLKYSCGTCQIQFYRELDLKRHNRSHTRDVPNVCEICTKTFSKAFMLRAHKQIHTGVKPHACEVCQKPFLKKSALERHRKIHSTEKPYSCEICTKMFADVSSLKRHKQSHTGQKPYYCEVCEKQFSQAANLREHQRSHTGEKPYSCQTCKKQFAKLSNLKRHKLSHVVA